MTTLKLNNDQADKGAIKAIIYFYESCGFECVENEEERGITSLVFENGYDAVCIDFEIVSTASCVEMTEMLEIAEFEI